MRRMKTMSLLLVLAAAAACGSDKPKVAQPTPPAADKPAPAADKPAPSIEKDTQVSPGIALSGDLASMCNIKGGAQKASPQFDYDKDELTAEDRAVLDQLAAC